MKKEMRCISVVFLIAVAITITACGGGGGLPADDGTTTTTGTSTSILKVSGGQQHGAALLSEGSILTWGRNLRAQLGTGTSYEHRGDEADEMGDSLASLDLGTGRTIVQISNSKDHACALLDNGNIKCWGNNDYGQLGYGDRARRGDDPSEMGDNLPAVDLGSNRTATAIVVGTSHSCAILDDDTVKCWGNSPGLGLGNRIIRGDDPGEMGDNLTPVDLGSGLTATAFTAGTNYTCALLNTGDVKCWGFNGVGRLGLGDTASRGDQADEMGNFLPVVALGTGRTATSISAHGAHACALLDNGAVKCWGNNYYGQLGQGDTANIGDAINEMGDNLPAINLGTDRTAVSIAVGDTHTCAVLDDFSTKCWGGNGNGQLGLEDTNNRGDAANEMGDNLPVVDLGTNRTAKAITAGRAHSCAVLDNDTLKCWGYNIYGQLGQGDTITRGVAVSQMGDNLPVANPGTGLTVTSISAGEFNNCATLSDFSLKCWGENDQGQLGDGNASHHGDEVGEMAELTPVNLGTERTAVDLVSGSEFTCALLDDATVKCWGLNTSGQLGSGTSEFYIGDATGEMGDGLLAIDLGVGRTSTQIAVGSSHACALLDDGSVKCWGYNFHGELGQGDTSSRGRTTFTMGDNLPAIDLGTDRTATAITIGTFHSCALLDDGSVKCWGSNYSGQLGQGNTLILGDAIDEMGDNLPAIDLGTGRTALSISANFNNTCAVLDDASLKCWGDNGVGQLGLEDTLHRGDAIDEMGDNLPAVDLGTGRTVVKVQAGIQTTCALLDDGSVKCWGTNFYGQLGQGDTSSRGHWVNTMGDNLLAIDLGAGRTATEIMYNYSRPCARLDTGDIKCWGDNQNGLLGLEDTENRGDEDGEMGDALPVLRFQ